MSMNQNRFDNNFPFSIFGSGPSSKLVVSVNLSEYHGVKVELLEIKKWRKPWVYTFSIETWVCLLCSSFILIYFCHRIRMWNVLQICNQKYEFWEDFCVNGFFLTTNLIIVFLCEGVMFPCDLINFDVIVYIKPMHIRNNICEVILHSATTSKIQRSCLEQVQYTQTKNMMAFSDYTCCFKYCTSRKVPVLCEDCH